MNAKNALRTLFATACLWGGAHAMAQTPRQVDFGNNTDRLLVGVYLSPHDEARWGKNSLVQPLASNDFVHVSVDTASADPVFDLGVEFEGGEVAVFAEACNLSEVTKLWITLDGDVVAVHTR